MGRVISLEVREGDRVTTGRLLARLDEDVLNAMLKIAKADMESAGRLEAAQAELRMHQESLEKLEELLQRNHATQREVDRARAQKEMAEARVKAAQEELAVKSLEYARTQAQLEQRRVLSPIDGVVTRVYKDAGEFVSPNDPILVKVVQLDPLLIVFSVPVAEARKLAADETVRVRIESAEEPVEGVVEFVSPMGDAQSGTMRVSVRIPNPGRTCTGRGDLPLTAPGRSRSAGQSSRIAMTATLCENEIGGAAVMPRGRGTRGPRTRRARFRGVRQARPEKQRPERSRGAAAGGLDRVARSRPDRPDAVGGLSRAGQ